MKTHIDNHYLHLIRQALGKFKVSGKEFIVLCPFHKDRSPSLRINQQRAVWYCYPCGRGGSLKGLARELGLVRAACPPPPRTSLTEHQDYDARCRAWDAKLATGEQPTLTLANFRAWSALHGSDHRTHTPDPPELQQRRGALEREFDGYCLAWSNAMSALARTHHDPLGEAAEAAHCMLDLLRKTVSAFWRQPGFVDREWFRCRVEDSNIWLTCAERDLHNLREPYSDRHNQRQDFGINEWLGWVRM